jgi:hypothetical protein
MTSGGLSAVVAHRLLADLQPRRCVSIIEALRDGVQYFSFSRRQLFGQSQCSATMRGRKSAAAPGGIGTIILIG